MAASKGIHGGTLEITVVGCNKLRDTEWISRQDPYVCLEYASSKFRTRTATDGGRNPTYNEKFVVSLIEGLHEISMQVWNSNTMSRDDFIGSGRIQLHKVLSEGFDDTAWSLNSRRGRYSGEVKVIMHYAGAKKQGYPAASAAPSSYPTAAYGPPPPYHMPTYPPYGQQAIPGYPPSSHPPASHYPAPASHHPAPASHYPPPASYYTPVNSYPPPPTAPPQPHAHVYRPPPYPPAHPGVYPPPPSY